MIIQDILNDNIIERNFYLERIEKYLYSPLVKVLIGLRRVGKSTLLKSIIQKLHKEKQIPHNNFFYVNKDLPDFDYINTYEDLKIKFEEFLKQTQKGRFFVGIDEIQEITGWEKFINGILAKYAENVEIFITGSNAFFLSGELSTYLTGRYIEFSIYPLSFDEFCLFSNKAPTEKLFFEYLKYGGLPAIFKMQYDESLIFSYLQGVYNTIILKDIVQYKSVRNIAFFRDLYKYVLSNISNVISGKSIKDYLKSQDISIGNDTVLNFLSYAEDTFLLNKIYSVNPETKKYFSIYNKYYVSDFGLRNSLVGFDLKRDIGKLLENYVFLELKRYGYQVQIGRLNGDFEIDFIAERRGVKKYFQVAYLLGNEETMEREYRSLENINDNWEKYVLSFDSINFGVHNGIKHIHIMKIHEIL